MCHVVQFQSPRYVPNLSVKRAKIYAEKYALLSKVKQSRVERIEGHWLADVANSAIAIPRNPCSLPKVFEKAYPEGELNYCYLEESERFILLYFSLSDEGDGGGGTDLGLPDSGPPLELSRAREILRERRQLVAHAQVRELLTDITVASSWLLHVIDALAQPAIRTGNAADIVGTAEKQFADFHTVHVPQALEALRNRTKLPPTGAGDYESFAYAI